MIIKSIDPKLYNSLTNLKFWCKSCFLLHIEWITPKSETITIPVNALAMSLLNYIMVGLLGKETLKKNSMVSKLFQL